MAVVCLSHRGSGIPCFGLEAILLQVLQQHPALKFIDLNGTYPLPEMNRDPDSYLRLLEDYQRLLFSLLPLRALEHVDLGSGTAVRVVKCSGSSDDDTNACFVAMDFD